MTFQLAGTTTSVSSIELHAIEIREEAAHLGLGPGRELRQGLGRRIEIDEIEAAENLQPDGLQAVLRLVEIIQPLAARRVAQIAGEIVAPGVIAAADDGAELAAPLQQQAVAAMLADIVEGPRLAIAPADHHHALIEDLLGQEIAGFLELVHMADRMPALVEDPVPLGLEDPGIVVVARGQGAGMGRVAGLPVQLLRGGEIGHGGGSSSCRRPRLRPPRPRT